VFCEVIKLYNEHNIQKKGKMFILTYKSHLNEKDLKGINEFEFVGIFKKEYEELDPEEFKKSKGERKDGVPIIQFSK
jgi:regulator of RNase E activity RraB